MEHHHAAAAPNNGPSNYLILQARGFWRFFSLPRPKENRYMYRAIQILAAIGLIASCPPTS